MRKSLTSKAPCLHLKVTAFFVGVDGYFDEALDFIEVDGVVVRLFDANVDVGLDRELTVLLQGDLGRGAIVAVNVAVDVRLRPVHAEWMDGYVGELDAVELLRAHDLLKIEPIMPHVKVVMVAQEQMLVSVHLSEWKQGASVLATAHGDVAQTIPGVFRLDKLVVEVHELLGHLDAVRERPITKLDDVVVPEVQIT